MNIMQIISGGEVGGSKNHLLALSSELKKRDIKNIIVCMMDGMLYEEALNMGLDVRLVKQKGRFDMSAVSRIAEILKNEKIDIVNCHGGRANFIGYFLKKKYRAFYISTIHSDYRDDYRGSIYKTMIFSNVNRFVLRSFDEYITVSDNFKKMLTDRGFDSSRISVVYNGIDFDRPHHDFDKQEIIKKYGIKAAGHYVTMVARFHPVKGHKVFIDACSETLKSFKDVVFILVGDGDTKRETEDYVNKLGIADNFVFTGYKVPDAYLFISDFTVLTSYTESFPLSILESAYYKKPVISTNVGGISKLIDDSVNGYLVNPGDSLSLCNKMLLMLHNNDNTKIMGQKLYDKASCNFSVKNLADAYVSILKKITRNGWEE